MTASNFCAVVGMREREEGVREGGREGKRERERERVRVSLTDRQKERGIEPVHFQNFNMVLFESTTASPNR